MALTSELEELASPKDFSTLGSQKSFQVPIPVMQAKKEVVAFFGHGVECIGEIWYEGNVQIDGKLEGVVHTKGTLVVGDRAVVKAKIEAGNVICKGNIQGEVMAKESIKLLSPGLISGTMKTPRLSVETGGVFNGRVNMGTSS